MSPYERSVTIAVMEDKRGMLSDTIRHAFSDSDGCHIHVVFFDSLYPSEYPSAAPDIIIVPLNWMPQRLVPDDHPVRHHTSGAITCVAVSPMNDAAIIHRVTGINIPYFVVPDAVFHQYLEYLRSRQPLSKEPRPISLHEARLKKAIAERTQYIGVPVHLKGYQYICAAIYLLTTCTDMHPGMTKVVYPTVANLYKTTASRVERSMRNAIGIAWDRSPDTFKNIFGGPMVRYCPTNNEFLSLMKEHFSREFPMQREDSPSQNLLA